MNLRFEMDKNNIEKVMDGVVRHLVAKDCNWRDYCNFKYMATHRALRQAWLLGSIIALVATIIGGIRHMDESSWGGLIITTLGSLIALRLLRLFFELLMRPFSMIELLREIRGQLKHNGQEGDPQK